MEILENRALIDRRDGAVTIRVTATDALSGVDHFTIVISNTDNAVSKTYFPGEDGCIVITITEDEPLFSGDLRYWDMLRIMWGMRAVSVTVRRNLHWKAV